jgi:hypothetical protein
MDIGDVIEDAYERIGKQLRSGYDYKTARRSLDYLLLEWQNRGLNLWTIQNASQTLTAGTASYELSSEKLDIIEGLLRTDAGSESAQTDLTMTRVSVSHYAHQTNKLHQGRPINFWIDRSPTNITVTLWPVPDATTPYVFNYYYMTRIEDTGKPASNTIDVPDRHLPALTAGLAYQLALKHPDVAPMLPTLKAEYEEQWNLAADSVREKAAFYVIPGGYNNI